MIIQDKALLLACVEKNEKIMIIETKILISPEADPAVLLAWVETEEDLTAIHNAAKVIKMIMRAIHD